MLLATPGICFCGAHDVPLNVDHHRLSSLNCLFETAYSAAPTSSLRRDVRSGRPTACSRRRRRELSAFSLVRCATMTA
jgi:hypothetical protein